MPERVIETNSSEGRFGDVIAVNEPHVVSRNLFDLPDVRLLVFVELNALPLVHTLRDVGP
jgi:hypothetical protein